jgi:tetratricopeptide (TPR) repeat protein
VTRPSGRGGDRSQSFFDHFRGAIARLPAGLIRVMPPAAPADLERAAAALGRPLPEVYRSFLRSFDGADLFHETVLLAGVGAAAPLALDALAQDRPDELVFAAAAGGDRYALDGGGRVLRYDAGAEERALAGSSFPSWLDATVAHEQILYGPDGEYAPDVFDPSGEEVAPLIALRQAERALKVDPGAADAEHARGLALGRLGRVEAALGALRASTALDPDNPWPWFDLGRAALACGRAETARAAFERAAALEVGAAGARLLAWAARAAQAAGDPAAVAGLRAQALARDGELAEALRRAAEAAGTDQDPDAYREALALLGAIAPDAPVSARLRLQVLSEPAARPPRPARPRRLDHAGPPRPGGSRRGS